MPQNVKQLFGATPGAASLTALYTVPAATQVIVSTLTACNRSATPTTIRLSHAPAGAADALTQYFAYDLALPGNSTMAFTLGISLAATDVLRGYAAAATVTFVGWGEERT